MQPLHPKRVFQTPANEHFFLGYYDKSPLDAQSGRLLAQRAQFADRMVTASDSLEIGVFDWRSGSGFEPIAETRAWNWQQGCMLQWLGPGHVRRLIFNDRRDGQFVSVIRDLASGAETVLPMAVYTVSPRGDQALCIDNERHYWFRPGYNYQGIEKPEKNVPMDPRDGIWRMDLATGRVDRVIPIQTLWAIHPLSTMATGIHYLEHLMFSPSGRRFCFLHRWKMEDGGIYARLFTAAPDGTDIRLLADSGRMSHFSWLDDETIIAYGGLPNPFNRLRQNRSLVRRWIRPLLPVYHALVPRKSGFRKALTGDGYMRLNDTTGAVCRIGADCLREDGHPTRCPAVDGLIVSDTYEDAGHHRELFLFDLKTEQKVWHTRLRSLAQLDSTGMRCDLHPKWSFDGAYFAVDTQNDGYRSIYLYARE